jgi:hypothetical protein
MPQKLTNYHVVDHSNIGDLMSSPLMYFDFPGFDCQTSDLRDINDKLDNSPSILQNQIAILGGGGLLFERFLPSIQSLQNSSSITASIIWGAGQQRYGSIKSVNFQEFDYASYTDTFKLVGIRDFDCGYDWVPCVSCMHPSFDKVRSPCHEYVVFSHKKFQISFPEFPRMTNENADMDSILDFLGSGETILTSSFHGAYWGTLLGRKVLAFPFSSKFFTLKHRPAFHSIKKWSNTQWKLSIFNKVLYELKYKNKFTCSLEGWQRSSQRIQAYPDSLEECREQNRNFHEKVLDVLSEK